MKKVILVSLTVFFFSSYIFAKNTQSKENLSLPSKNKSVSFDGYKEILYKLVKQDEILDEALEKSKNSKLTESFLSEMAVLAKNAQKNLNEAAVLNKNQLAFVSPGSETSKYTRTIMAYANKIDRKIRAISANIEKASYSPAYRNAPISSKKTAKGKKLTQILKEKENLDNLKKELLSLQKTSQKVKASGKWLYIASK
ncbi:MAG: hypothetical protein GX447_05820 [Elusimicrobia bacterium]|nr:hypothetical protein [Elusimicrobiota bacterium]